MVMITSRALVGRNVLLKVKLRTSRPEVQPTFNPLLLTPLKEDKTRKVSEKHIDVVHWKPVFFILGKNKAGHLFANQLSILLQLLADESIRSNFSMIATMALPHLVLAKTKDSYDDSIA